MKTSKLKLRPFIAGRQIETGDKELDDKQRKMLLELKADKREPFATLTFGNVTIELDYTIFRKLELEVGHEYDRVRDIFNLGKEEMLKEMDMAIDGREEVDENTWFRDNPKKCSITHINSPLRLEEDNWRSLIDGRRNMEWEKFDSKEDNK